MHNSKISIVIPLYNDWESLELLLLQFRKKIDSHLFTQFTFLIINDSSPIQHQFAITENKETIQILHLARNLGHQKAIAIGLAYLQAENKSDIVIVMDSDGEDKPEHIMHLLDCSKKNFKTIVFAKRKKRHEGFVFQFLYQIYKFLFSLLTGKSIAFGNFSLIPFFLLTKLVYVSEIWNHFSGGVIRSKLPYTAIPLERGKRLAGKSKMNFSSLIIHGLSAIAVHIDTVAVRLLIFSATLVFATLMGVFVVAYIRLFTSLAIPGWASFVVLGLGIIFMQACLTSLFLVFIVLTYRTQQHFIPALHYKDFIIEIENIRFE